MSSSIATFDIEVATIDPELLFFTLSNAVIDGDYDLMVHIDQTAPWESPEDARRSRTLALRDLLSWPSGLTPDEIYQFTEYLLSRSVLTNYSTPDDDNLLHFACHPVSGTPALIYLLAGHGVDWKQRNCLGYTPLEACLALRNSTPHVSNPSPDPLEANLEALQRLEYGWWPSRPRSLGRMTGDGEEVLALIMVSTLQKEESSWSLPTFLVELVTTYVPFQYS